MRYVSEWCVESDCNRGDNELWVKEGMRSLAPREHDYGSGVVCSLPLFSFQVQCSLLQGRMYAGFWLSVALKPGSGTLKLVEHSKVEVSWHARCKVGGSSDAPQQRRGQLGNNHQPLLNVPPQKSIQHQPQVPAMQGTACVA